MPVVAIADGLYGLVYPVELDGRASSAPVDVRGWSTMNCYLLLEDDAAMLISTGYSSHQDALLADLADLVGDRPLTVVVSRVEFPAMCNGRPIADRFRVERVLRRLPATASGLLNFRPEFELGAADGLRDVETSNIDVGRPAPVGSGGRELEFLMPHLRLLPSNWGYDHVTGTLFSGDMFCWTWQDAREGLWLIQHEEDDPTTSQRIEDSLIHNRYWWLAGAETDALRAYFDELFTTYDVRVIAPDHGAILRGDAVERHRRMLDEVLAAVEQRASVGIAAGRWTTAGVR